MTRNEAIAIRSAQLSGTPVTAEELSGAIAILSQAKPPRDARANPWGLTAGQCEVMGAITETGNDELAAERLGIGHKTVSTQFQRAKDRMGVDNRMLAILEWDRWARTQP